MRDNVFDSRKFSKKSLTVNNFFHLIILRQLFDDPDEPIVAIPLTGIAEDDTNKSGSGTTPTAPGGLTTSGGGGGGGGCFIGTAEHSSSGLTGWFLIVGAITLWFTCSVVRKRTN